MSAWPELHLTSELVTTHYVRVDTPVADCKPLCPHICTACRAAVRAARLLPSHNLMATGAIRSTHTIRNHRSKPPTVRGAWNLWHTAATVYTLRMPCML